ncbi:sensory box histidine kinase/response regulator [hydrothermal vent metagenome]|uniref:histidine kinase n=1 Tax=hydrothermal vent metagenome TaxID=652676 RepID=A0A3B0YF05_9ZZZZ
MSFRIKTILGIALIQTSLLIFMIFMILNFVKQAQNREIIERATTTVNMFASTSREALLSSDLATLETAVNEMLNNPGIVYTRIIDAEGKVMAKAGKPLALQARFIEDNNLAQAISDGTFDVFANIEIDGAILGSMQLGISTENLLADIILIRNYSLSMASAGVLLMIFFSFLLGSWLTRQLERLKDAAINIEQGQLGHQVEVKGNDEIAHTARAFNTMSVTLKELDAQRLQTMKKLEESEERSRLLLNSAAEGIYGINSNCNISFANPAAVKLLGFSSPDQMIDINLDAFFKNETQLLSIQQCLISGKTNRARDVTVHTHNKQIIHIDYTCSPVHKNASISGAVIIFSDISIRKEAEQAIEKAHQNALEHAQAKADFMANMSHEIRTPMNGVIGLLQLFEKDKLSESYAHYIETALDSANHLMILIDDILDFSKNDSGKLQLANNNFELSQLLNECIESNYKSAQKKQLKLKSDYSFNTSWARGDSVRLQKIINNLIDNAIKFSSQGSIKLEARLIEETGPYKHYEFSVSDSGIGISEELQDKLFDSFHQANASTTREFNGMGLGLAICRQLIEKMGGTIRVESQPHQGSRFYFDIKLKKSDIDIAKDSE